MTSERLQFVVLLSRLLSRAALVVALAASCSGENQPERSPEALCAELRRLEGIDRILGDLETSRLSEMREPLEKMVDVAPEDILPAVRDVSAVVGEVVDRLGDVPDGDVDAAKRALAPIQERLRRAASAAEELAAYARSKCSLRL
ncbi:MAG: hypothetical protein KatS3mg008_2047 [Acidimicrobiales bacterium]|nr:MAG: hypothetical protein KatS3mg008_2047 [Acidimicrobiales bacterium]